MYTVLSLLWCLLQSSDRTVGTMWRAVKVAGFCIVTTLAAAVVFLTTAQRAVAAAPAGGYWEVTAAGDVYSFGAAPFYGSAGNLTLSKPIVSMAVTADGGGYWLVASDGGVFSYGDAGYYGSLPGLPAADQPGSPVVGLVPAPSGSGYWEVTAAGDVYSFGAAPFYGSAGNLTLSKPIVSMAATSDSGGYWLVASDGGVFAYGDAAYYGSLPGLPAADQPGSAVVDLVPARPPAPAPEPTPQPVSPPPTATPPPPTPAPLSVATAVLPSATAGSPYSAALTATGGTAPYSWSVVAGALPPGLSLSPTGFISGTPTSSGEASFEVQVVGSSAPTPQKADATLAISVATPPITQSGNWSGYTVPSSADIITFASGEWTVPAVNCAATPNGETAIWVGIGGDTYPTGGSSGVLLQTGVSVACNGGQPQYWAWWEEYPDLPNQPDPFQGMTISPGDTIEATIYQTTSGSWASRVDDLTTGISGIMVTGAGWGVGIDGDPSSLVLEGITTDLPYSGGYSAEWIVEDPGAPPNQAPFADYGTVTFSGLRTSLSQWYLTPDEATEIVQGGVVLSTPSLPSADGFSVSYTG